MKTYKHHRRGIALITAIAFLLIVATLMAIMVSMTTLTTKRGADLYFQEQAHLLAKSATEFALLAISGHDIVGNGDCVNTIDIEYPRTNPFYNVDTTIRYYGNGLPASPNCNVLDNTIVTPETNGTIMIDVVVTLDPSAGMSEPVRFHRRTIQKP